MHQVMAEIAGGVDPDAEDADGQAPLMVAVAGKLTVLYRDLRLST